MNQATLTLAIAVLVFVIGALGYLRKATNDKATFLEQQSQKHAAIYTEIKTTKKDLVDVLVSKERCILISESFQGDMKEIKGDIKTLLSRKEV